MDEEAVRLERDILAAHESTDGFALVELYERGAELKARLNEPEAQAFLYTQAYVFALESGHDHAAALRQKLISLGREAPEAGSDQ